MADVTAAATLVGRALDVRAVAGTDPDYAELLRRYRFEDSFRETVDSVCAGLGLGVIDAVDQGLIIAPDSDSVFSMGSVADFEPGLNPDQRVMLGVIHLCIAATAYPLEGDTERVVVVRLRTSQIERVLRESARIISERAAEADAQAVGPELRGANGTTTSDERERPGGIDPELRSALDLLAAMPTRKPVPKRAASGRRSRGTSLGLIAMAFEQLVEHGCFRKVAGGEEDAEYLALDRYRLQVRERAMVDAHEALRDLMVEAAASHADDTEPGVSSQGAICESLESQADLSGRDPA
jgi:hypothetical protein